MFKTTRNLACTLPTGGRLAYDFVLPKGSRVKWIEDYSGTTGAAFAVADVAQIARLTGNKHDSQYHYVTVPANAVIGDTPEQAKTVARMIAKEAELARSARGSGPIAPYIHARVITVNDRDTDLARVFLWVGYEPSGNRAHSAAMHSVKMLAGGNAEIWDGAAYPVGDDVTARGPGLWEISAGDLADGLSRYRVRVLDGDEPDEAAAFSAVRREFGPAVWAHDDAAAIAAALQLGGMGGGK